MKHAGWIVAAAVVLLALTQGRPTAGPMQPVPVGIAPAQINTDLVIARLWSDGAVDATRVDYPGICTQGQGPICNGPTILIPGTCPGDITRDGNVATADLLGVLETWGPCE